MVYHKHTRKCTNIDRDGICRFVKHSDNCLSEKSQMLKRNYRIHLKQVVKHNPCAKNDEIINISNSNFQLNDEYINSHNINISNEKKVISRNRIKQAEPAMVCAPHLFLLLLLISVL